MTKEDLVELGYTLERCKIGELYFNGTFFCRLLENGEVDFRLSENDTYSFGKAKSVEELRALEKDYWIQTREKYLRRIKFIDLVLESYDKPANS